MPPIVALILCTVFVIFLLRLEHKQYPDASAALWIPTIWFLLNTSKPLGIWFGAGGETMEDGSILDRIVLTVILCSCIIIIIKRKFNIFSALKNNIWVFMLLSMTLASTLWSDIPFVSFKRWIRDAALPLTIAFVLASETDPYNALQSLLRRTIYVHIPFSLMLIKYYPHFGDVYARWSGKQMWVGVSVHKNGLAFLCILAIFYFVWSFVTRRKDIDIKVAWYQYYLEILVFLLSIWLFLGPNHTPANSATSTVALAAGLLFLTGLLWLKRINIIPSQKFLITIIAFIIIYGTITPFAGGIVGYNPSEALGREETLTGRTDIWAFLTPLAMHKPLLGYGYGGFWTEAIREKTSSHAHNGYLDIVLNTGFVGLFLWSMFLIASCWAASNKMRHDFKWGIVWFCLILIDVIHNIAESSSISLSGLLPSILLFLLIINTEDFKKHGDVKAQPSLLNT